MASLPQKHVANKVNPLLANEIIPTVIPVEGISKKLFAPVKNDTTAIKKSRKPGQEPIHKKANDSKSICSSPRASNSVSKHGLAPTGMAIPLQKNAFRVGGCDIEKCPLKETSQEKYHRIKAEREVRQKKKNIRAANKLKKSGKVATLAPFMF